MSYRELFRSAGPVFLPLGFVARLPYAMTPLGTLVLLQAATGSFGFAGACAGVESLAIGAGGVAVGRLAERFGPRRVGALAAVLNAAAVVALVAASSGGRPGVVAAAVAVGLTQPQVGPLVRVHWSQLSRTHPRGSGLIDRALSYEAAADEASFVLGPAAVGLLATISTPLGPAVPLAAVAALLLAAAAPLALAYREPTGHQQRTDRRPPLPAGRLAAMVGAMATVGAIFGALQTGVTGYAAGLGDPGLAGLLYAALAAGSAAAGVAYGWLPARITPGYRYLASATALLLGMGVLATGGAVLPIPVAFILAGATIAPYMIGIYARTERLAPKRIATAMTMLTAGGPVGTAAGQAGAGWLADAYSYRAAFALAPILAGLALLLALTVLAAERRRTADHPHADRAPAT